MGTPNPSCPPDFKPQSFLNMDLHDPHWFESMKLLIESSFDNTQPFFLKENFLESEFPQLCLHLLIFLRCAKIVFKVLSNKGLTIWREAYAIGFLHGKLGLLTSLLDPELKSLHHKEKSRSGRASRGFRVPIRRLKEEGVS